MDRKAIERLLVSEYSGLLTILRRHIGDEHLAADLLNDALVLALEHLNDGKVSDPSAIAGYVFRVACNLFRNHRRKHAERPDKRVDPDDALLISAETRASDWSRQVRELLNELPAERDRIALKRFYLDEEEKEIICAELGLSSRHFEKVLFRARHRMKLLLQSKGLGKGDFLSILL